MHKRLFDKLGITLSFICIIHCMALPFMVMALPALRTYTESEGFHTLMVFLVTLTAGLAFIPGYLRHKDKKLIVLVITSLVLIVLGIVLGHELGIDPGHTHDDGHDHMNFGVLAERIVTTIGSILLIYCHFRNIKHKGHCDHCEHDEEELAQ
jgi:hypothetical protein